MATAIGVVSSPSGQRGRSKKRRKRKTRLRWEGRQKSFPFSPRHRRRRSRWPRRRRRFRRRRPFFRRRRRLPFIPNSTRHCGRRCRRDDGDGDDDGASMVNSPRASVDRYVGSLALVGSSRSSRGGGGGSSSRGASDVSSTLSRQTRPGGPRERGRAAAAGWAVGVRDSLESASSEFLHSSSLSETGEGERDRGPSPS